MTARNEQNYTRRFYHTMREAGLMGPLSIPPRDRGGRWSTAFACAAIGMAVLYVFLVCVLSA